MPTIHEIKEQSIPQTPLILFECQLGSGTVYYWSTHAVSYSGHSYQARVLRHNLFEMRWGAEDGIDSLSQVSVALANADGYVSQIAASGAWKGAKLIARFLFFDLKNGVAASEAMVLFQGLVNPPDEVTESAVRVSAHNRLSLQRYLLPEIRIQRRCPWSFPSNATQRQEAVDGGARGKFSPFYRCGYSPDQQGGLGSLNSGQAYTSCDYTRGSCAERGMFDRDSQDRVTRRFGGVEFVPASVLVRGHGESGFHVANAVENEARYNDQVPIHYGTVWTQPPVVFARNDGNLTRLEVLLGAGEINRVVKVIVNGVEVPQGVTGANMTATGWYNLVSRGSASGAFNLEFSDAAGNPLGDPYGSMAFLAVSVPNRVSDGRSLPSVKVLLEGLKVATYATDGSFQGEVYSNNPAWVLLDMFRRSGWTADEIALDSFARAAAYCAEGISVPDLYGNMQLTPRFQCNVPLRRRKSVADWIRGVRNSSRLFIRYGETGLLEVCVEGTLAEQQGEKPAASNATVELNGGWPAYEFGDGTNGFSGIARRENGESSLRLRYRSAAETPNRTSIEFQDAFNEFQQDSLSLVDVEDAALARQEISVTSSALGVPNFHQAARVLKLQLDKSIRGNLYVEFETSVKAVGLRPGDLITLTYQKEGFDRRLFRITRIVPSLNHARALIEAQFHDDAWYSDDPGAGGGNRVARRQRGAEIGQPRPLVGAIFDASQQQQYSVAEETETEADGGAVVTLEVGFTAPVRPVLIGLDVPLVSLTPVIETTGGTLSGGQTLYYAVTAAGANGAESDVSFVVRADIPATTNTNRARLEGLSLPSAATGFHVYRGANPHQLLRIAANIPAASSFTDIGLAATLAGPPDENFDHARFEWRSEMHPEVTASAASSSTVTSAALDLTANEFSGMTVRITGGKGAGQERVIVSHTSSVVTITPPWTLVPDTTSKFVIVESSWQLGATGATSPVRFSVPNRPGAALHIAGMAVNALGRDGGRALSPMTRWLVGGSAGSLIDSEVPPLPEYSIGLAGDGSVELSGVTFPTLTNTHSIHAGTLTLHYRDELAAPNTLALAAALTASGTTVTLSGPTTLFVGGLLQVDSEVMEVEEVSNGGATLEVRRASHDTVAAAHTGGALAFVLDRRAYVIPFSQDFFGSPASGSFRHPIFLPDVRLAAADFFVTNTRGNSETRKVNFTGLPDKGLRTLSGGQITIQVEGSLAIQTSAAPPLVIETAHSVRDIFAVVSDAPTGAAVQLQLRQNNTVYCTLNIPIGAAISNVVNGFNLPPLEAMSKLSLDILSVGQTGETTPGRDLTVTLRL